MWIVAHILFIILLVFLAFEYLAVTLAVLRVYLFFINVCLIYAVIELAVKEDWPGLAGCLIGGILVWIAFYRDRWRTFWSGQATVRAGPETPLTLQQILYEVKTSRVIHGWLKFLFMTLLTLFVLALGVALHDGWRPGDPWPIEQAPKPPQAFTPFVSPSARGFPSPAPGIVENGVYCRCPREVLFLAAMNARQSSIADAVYTAINQVDGGTEQEVIPWRASPGQFQRTLKSFNHRGTGCPAVSAAR